MHHPRAACGGCGNTTLNQALDLGASPLADDFPTEPCSDSRVETFPIGLQHCHMCTMLQLSYVVDDATLWGGDYGFYTSGSPSAVRHFTDYAKFVIKNFPVPARRGVVEIACNDGTLLAHLGNAGYPVHGIDPAAGPVAAARARGLTVTHAGLTWEVAQNHVTWYGHAGLVIANNVIAHVADLDDFVRSLAYLLDDDGVGLVEFQYGPDLIAQNAFDHVYHEHRFFLTLTALQQVLTPYGLAAVSVQHNDMQRGSLRVTILRAGKDTWPDHSVRDLIRSEKWLTNAYALRGMQGVANHIRTRLVDILYQARVDGLHVAGYGASAKATTLLSWCGIDEDLVRYVVDVTPQKYGRYMPGTSIPIVAPTADSRRPDMYLMLVSNYLSAILRKETTYTATGGKWLVPLPYPTVL